MSDNLNPQPLESQIISAIRASIGERDGPVCLHEPSFIGNEWVYLKECLDSTYVSAVGKFVDRFEFDLASYTGSKYVVAVVNGTAALHIALKLSGVGYDDEVLVPALTFVATANAVKYCNATPHFVDSEAVTLGMDSERLRDYLSFYTNQFSGHCVSKKSGKVIKAMVPMHTFGHPADMDGLLAIGNDFNILLIEDAAESLGSYYYGRHTGTFGHFGILSFNGNKTITTGGGGALLTNDHALAKRAKHITTTAKKIHPWGFIHDEVAFNYRLPNLNAALGCAQLENLPQLLKAKRKLFEHYAKEFSLISGLKLFAEPENCTSNYWLQTLLLDHDNVGYRDLILKETNNAGLMTRPAWTPINQLAPFSRDPSMDLCVSESLFARIINIPSSANLTLS